MFRKIVPSLAALAVLSVPSLSRANWTPTTAGPHSYNDTGNWTGGTINGQFSSALSADQVVTFDQNTAAANVSDEFNFTYATDFDTTLRSDSATTRTLTLNQFAGRHRLINVNSSASSPVRTITFEDSLVLDVGSSLNDIKTANGTDLVLASKITGSGAMIFSTGASSGSITLSNATSDFTGDVILGIARPLRITSIADVGVASAAGAGSAIRFLNGTSGTNLEYTGATASTNRTVKMDATGPTGVMSIDNVGSGKLTFTGNFVRSSATDSILQFRGTQDIAVTGVINNSGGANALSVVKDGSNTLTLSGANLYTGTTTVTGGTLLINGDNSTATGNVTVASGATLGGSGTVGGATTISAGATHSPGNSPGLQTFANGLAYETSSNLQWELTDDTTAGRGSNFDGIDVTGGALSIETGVVANLVFNDAGSLVNFNDAFWDADQSWVLFSNANSATLNSVSIFDSVTTTVDGFGNSFSITGGSFDFSQSGNDVLLNYTAVPEPSTLALLFGVGSVLAVVSARRRRCAA